MKQTDLLKLKKPEANDFYNVEDFNYNMDRLEAQAADEKAREATIVVSAPAGCLVQLWHAGTGYQSVTASQEAEASFTVPCGGHIVISYFIDGKCKYTIDDDIEDGIHLVIPMFDSVGITYPSVLSTIPSGTFSAGGACENGGQYTYLYRGELCGVDRYRHTFAYFQKIYEDTAGNDSNRADAMTLLWDAVRIGLLTQAQYKTITGTAYPAASPMRTELKKPLEVDWPNCRPMDMQVDCSLDEETVG